MTFDPFHDNASSCESTIICRVEKAHEAQEFAGLSSKSTSKSSPDCRTFDGEGHWVNSRDGQGPRAVEAVGGAVGGVCSDEEYGSREADSKGRSQERSF